MNMDKKTLKKLKYEWMGNQKATDLVNMLVEDIEELLSEKEQLTTTLNKATEILQEMKDNAKHVKIMCARADKYAEDNDVVECNSCGSCSLQSAVMRNMYQLCKYLRKNSIQPKKDQS